MPSVMTSLTPSPLCGSRSTSRLGSGTLRPGPQCLCEVAHSLIHFSARLNDVAEDVSPTRTFAEYMVCIIIAAPGQAAASFCSTFATKLLYVVAFDQMDEELPCRANLLFGFFLLC